MLHQIKKCPIAEEERDRGHGAPHRRVVKRHPGGGWGGSGDSCRAGLKATGAQGDGSTEDSERRTSKKESEADR